MSGARNGVSGRALRGYDAGKKINGRKRHAVVDTIGLLFGLVVHAADVQDRDGAPAVLASIRRSCPWLRHVFADGGYAGPKLRGALAPIGAWTIEVVKRSDTAKGFEVLPRRWVVERTFAWLGRCRRLAVGDSLGEIRRRSAEAWINISHRAPSSPDALQGIVMPDGVSSRGTPSIAERYPRHRTDR